MESILGSGRLSVGTHRVELFSFANRMAVFLSTTKTGAHAYQFPEGVELPTLQLRQTYTIRVVPHGALLHRPAGKWAFVEMEYGVPVAELTQPADTLQAALDLLEQSDYTGGMVDFVVKEIRDGESVLYTAHTTRTAISTTTGVRSFETTRAGGRTTPPDET